MEEEEETFTSWVLDTLGGVKEEIFQSLVNTEGNTSWVDRIVGTLVNEKEEYNEIYSWNQEEEEEEDDKSCAIVTWRCMSQVWGRDTSSPSSSHLDHNHNDLLDHQDNLYHHHFSLRSLKVEFAISANPEVFGGEL